MIDWSALESPLTPTPRFHVEAPDGRKDWAEQGKGGRQEAFIAAMHRLAPRVMVYHIANEGKRSPFLAKRSGIMAGVFDNQVYWKHPLAALVEFKGYSKAGRPGQLSDAQVEYGNRMVELGWHVGCFFDPMAAVQWLKDCGFPVMAARVAA